MIYANILLWPLSVSQWDLERASNKILCDSGHRELLHSDVLKVDERHLGCSFKAIYYYTHLLPLTIIPSKVACTTIWILGQMKKRVEKQSPRRSLRLLSSLPLTLTQDRLVLLDMTLPNWNSQWLTFFCVCEPYPLCENSQDPHHFHLSLKMQGYSMRRGCIERHLV